MGVTFTISLDFVLIARCLGALVWGIALALFLQHHRIGRYLAEEKTWITVVLGVGVDLLIAWQAEWLVVCAVIVFSSAGIIFRSLYNDGFEPNPQSYKLKHRLEDAIDDLGDVINLLSMALDDGKAGNVSKALSKVHRAQRMLTLARYGEPER